MITYDKSPFGLNLLFRVHGSAVYRASILGLIAVGFSVLFRSVSELEQRVDKDADSQLLHPYAIGIMVAGTSFLLVFRLQQAYSRYWEAASAVHHMMSKWMDAVIHTSAYHLQSSHYDSIKPPSYFDHHELNNLFLSRDRERLEDEWEQVLEQETPVESSHNQSASSAQPNNTALNPTTSQTRRRIQTRALHKSIEQVQFEVSSNLRQSTRKLQQTTTSTSNLYENYEDDKNLPRANIMNENKSSHVSSRFSANSNNMQPQRLEGPPRLDGNWGNLFPPTDPNKPKKSTYFDPKHPRRIDPTGFASHQGGQTPSLFLQELAHLTSLLTGVALSTLRNDVEGAESPLDIYIPGSPWPDVDPDANGGLYKGDWVANFRQKVYNFIGVGRSDEERTKYNAARPLPVLGGVSDAEIRFLQTARGPYAKTQLCWFWLSEFVTREHLAGSTGAVGPPIISRIIQFLGDGMIYYNHARKITFIPFPFAHAQLSVIYVLALIPTVAFLMDQYVRELWIACVLTFLAMAVLAGVNEVARELENPFRNVPNELPLVTMQAQFNEALIVMFAGYHPDSYWKAEANILKRAPPSSVEKTGKMDDIGEDSKVTFEASMTSTLLSHSHDDSSRVPLTSVSDEEDRRSNSGTPPNGSNVQAMSSSQGSLEEQMARLLAKMEEQSKEISMLRSMVHDNGAKEKAT